MRIARRSALRARAARGFEGRWLTLAAALAAALLLGSESARAEDPPAEGWRFTIAPYLWATTLEGDVTVRGRKASVDESFIDILQATDSIIGIEGRGEAWNDNWGFYVDGIYNRLDVENDERPLVSFEIVTELSILEAGMLYRIGTWPLASGWSGRPPDGPTLELDAYAGARYTSLEIENKLTVGNTIFKADGDRDWVDPILGARAILDLDRRWQMMLGGDIGGFGAGANFTWSALGLVGYRYSLFGIDMTSVAGYKALYQDYDHGSGSDRFEWDMTLHGPIIGTVIRF
ncbi:MAG: hypothetical protein AB7F08_03980 [Dongiaceae bacterium]